ncbi:MAG: type I-E CRISPR-associated protein Cse2/CasB [Thermodesulfobacteriota bacterium]
MPKLRSELEAAKRPFTGDDYPSEVLLVWWHELGKNRGAAATLRRATDPGAVAFSPAFHRLLDGLRAAGCPLGPREADRLAAVAGLAAHVKSHTPGASLAQQMAAAKAPGSGARVSGLRFRRLLAVAERDELYPLLIRVIRQLGGAVNLVSLANAVFWWNERTRTTWAYEYYAACPSEP